MDPKIAFCSTNVNFQQTKFQSQKLIIKISQTEFKLIRETFFWYVENKVFYFPRNSNAAKIYENCEN